MENNGIPLVNVPMGPGSQDEGDMVLDYMKMPSEMASYDIPILPEAETVAEYPQAIALMDVLQRSLDSYQVGSETHKITLNALGEGDLEIMNQILGEGEVSISIAGIQPVKTQETVLAGVWRLRRFSESGELIDDIIEIADVPQLASLNAFSTQHELKFDADNIPAGVLNAPSVLVEIQEASAQYRQAQMEGVAIEFAHVINLSLLPFSPQDHAFLSQVTGTGPVTILSRGYGNCRITSTQIEGLWRVQYFNSTDQLILDTLEITEMPLVACAAQEDLDDSSERLKEIREVLI
ncbi:MULTISPECIES: hydrogenase expression/formation protein [unclassified Neptuniibacter]|uniref:hydrogenase expression/formation protein n=1 Tax=unclassified Neptuniibacter TaxID=2630693 RepID=UPI000C5258A8|nr:MULTISPECIES: hydrogenase expression/formation protein [unclassified Neptuniibacter]MAY42576.1 hydrogenase expression/formation protein [Oceanospirillaceae bacterium]|tara:strand:+ start:25428 stop:26306 length:879 start_codon:yes stop_codon:yes gene_type:complete